MVRATKGARKAESGRISLTDAGLRAGLGYWRIRNAVMRGEVKGGKDEGSWWVDATDLDRFILTLRPAESAVA